MLRVLFIKEVVGLGLQLSRQLLQNDSEQRIDRFLLCGISMPDRNQVGIESHGQTDTAKLVAYL